MATSQELGSVNLYEKGGVPNSTTVKRRKPSLRNSTLLERLLITLCLFVVFTTLWIIHDINVPRKAGQFSAGISPEAYKYGLSKCAEINRERPSNKFEGVQRRNPRFVPGTKTYALTNGIILDGVGGKILGDIILRDGIIVAVGQDLSYDEDTVVIDLNKKFVTPGLVDMHSHLGVYSWPGLSATNDGNEESDPLTPYVRAQDGLNPSDPGIRIIKSGGVTTSLVLPGSANLMGGEGYAIKLRPVDTLSVDDMSVTANVSRDEERTWRWLKMACGENPKRVHGIDRGVMPFTRMGEAWLFRKQFAEASDLKRRQDDWCDISAKFGNSERLNTNFPEDLRNDGLIALLRGDARLNIHCYETYDIEAMIRHSLEFNFTITAFHHGLDAYRIPDVIKRAKGNITIATFSDLWGYKKESFQASTKSPKILSDANIPVALKSDHPILNAQHLIFEAAKAHHYGLDEKLALAAVTSVPANALGLGYRIGQISVGYDADVVVWNNHPLSLGARPLEVYIDGIPQFNVDTSVLEKESLESRHLKNKLNPPEPPRNTAKSRTATSFLIKNIGKVFVDEENIMDAYQSTEEKISIMVKDGLIKCIGTNCTSTDQISSYEVIDLNNGYVIPGITAVGSNLGLSEIGEESVTQDGIVTSNDYNNVIHAVDGLKLGGKHLEVAYKAGVLTAVTSPLSRRGVVAGISVAFKTGAQTGGRVILKEAVALHTQIGAPFKDEKVPTISGQISLLRKILMAKLTSNSSDDVFGLAVRGRVPLIVHTHSKDEIASLIRLKDRISSRGGNVRLVILGGAEAHLLARELAHRNIPVVLLPPRPTPEQWTAQNVLTGAPIDDKMGIDILHAHGVTIGIGVSEPGLSRNLVWDAGWAQKNSDGLISEKDAVGFITWNFGKIFKIDALSNGNVLMTEDNRANFVAYDGSPFDMKTRIRVVAGGGRDVALIDPDEE
ncbi:1210_t:CDS:10 [Acaulospora colombiana]|uniref:1210_t:CDS:1 n=1 Tax=Acaulospora colombiana TaxID=27376 RepID=A0ACA9M781_9GLOM|nr:1210_t:CDS:10 [Acaulospora colombiana]